MNVNNWSEWQNYVLSTLESLQFDVRELHKVQLEMQRELTQIRERFRLVAWIYTAGLMLVSTLSAVITYFLK